MVVGRPCGQAEQGACDAGFHAVVRHPWLRVFVSGSPSTHGKLSAYLANRRGKDTRQPAGGTGVAVLRLDRVWIGPADYLEERMKFR